MLTSSLRAPRRAGNKPGSTDDMPEITGERQHSSSMHLESLWNSLRKLTSLGILQVPIRIIATTYHSTIFKTQVFSPYSPLCFYTTTHRHTVRQGWVQAEIESNSRCTWIWPLSFPCDSLWGGDRATLMMHVDAVIERIWRYTQRPCSNELWDGHQYCDWASVEMYF